MSNQKNGKPPQAPPTGSPVTSPVAEVKNERQKAEQNEVAGRHKNDGQMGHKGAR